MYEQQQLSTNLMLARIDYLEFFYQYVHVDKVVICWDNLISLRLLLIEMLLTENMNEKINEAKFFRKTYLSRGLFQLSLWKPLVLWSQFITWRLLPLPASVDCFFPMVVKCLLRPDTDTYRLCFCPTWFCIWILS